VDVTYNFDKDHHVQVERVVGESGIVSAPSLLDYRRHKYVYEMVLAQLAQGAR
jgi:hypothetical protein